MNKKEDRPAPSSEEGTLQRLQMSDLLIQKLWARGYERFTDWISVVQQLGLRSAEQNHHEH